MYVCMCVYLHMYPHQCITHMACPHLGRDTLQQHTPTRCNTLHAAHHAPVTARTQTFVQKQWDARHVDANAETFESSHIKYE